MAFLCSTRYKIKRASPNGGEWVSEKQTEFLRWEVTVLVSLHTLLQPVNRVFIAVLRQFKKRKRRALCSDHFCGSFEYVNICKQVKTTLETELSSRTFNQPHPPELLFPVCPYRNALQALQHPHRVCCVSVRQGSRGYNSHLPLAYILKGDAEGKEIRQKVELVLANCLFQTQPQGKQVWERDLEH